MQFAMRCNEDRTWSAASSSSAIVLLFCCCAGAAGLRGFLPGGGAAAGCLLVSLDKSACVTEGAACSVHTQNEQLDSNQQRQSSVHIYIRTEAHSNASGDPNGMTCLGSARCWCWRSCCCCAATQTFARLGSCKHLLQLLLAGIVQLLCVLQGKCACSSIGLVRAAEGAEAKP